LTLVVDYIVGPFCVNCQSKKLNDITAINNNTNLTKNSYKPFHVNNFNNTVVNKC